MIYFDNASTTAVSDKAVEAAEEMLKKYYANPSALHSFGFEAEKKLEWAREQVARAIGADREEIFFTSGGTEANNTAILGAARAYKRSGNRVITNHIEHPSVGESFKQLEEEGFEVLYAPVDKNGCVIVDKLLEMIDDSVILVSIMHVNNEVGSINDVEEIGRKIKEVNKNTIFHVDNVQGFGKHKIGVKNIDLMSISAHKIHGLKGCGGLYIKKGTRLKSLIYGGSQQKSIRPGTENTAGIYSMGVVCRESFDNINDNYNLVKKVKEAFMKGLEGLDGVSVNGDFEKASPYILSLSFEGIRGEVLLHSLEERDIFVSTGSACSTRAKNHLSVIDYLDKSKKEGTVRFSFSHYNTTEEAEECARAVKELVPMLRLYKRR